MSYYNTLNHTVRSRSEAAAEKLRIAWGYGGPNTYWPMKDFADWFEDLYYDFVELHDDGWLTEQAKWAALEACEEMLALSEDVDHDRHLKYIVRIRHLIFPDAGWGDWPCDVTGMEESSDEEDDDMMFSMDDM